MDTAAARPPSELLLELAQQCISGALRFDYLSNGIGHRQSAVSWGSGVALPAKVGVGATSQGIVRRYLTEIATRKRLSSSEEYCLASSASKGDADARRRLIEHQLGLVVMMARPYRNRGLPLLDLIEEGNIGLMTAIEKFDPERGCRFSTYAKWWIRQSIELALMTQTNVVRIPVHVTRAMKQRSRQHARAAADSASCEESPRLTASRVAPQRGTADFLLHDVRNRQDSNHGESHDEPQALIDRVAAPEHEQPDWYLQVTGQRKYLNAAMQQLKDTEQLVLRSRFGLVDDIDCTLQTVAKELNLSTERVRQIQTEALTKLRRLLQADLGHDRTEGF
jgi:RNA polymerase nonessential primary-like sigma factor